MNRATVAERYPLLAEALAEDYAHLDAAYVETVFDEIGLEAEDVEGFLDVLGGIGRTVGQGLSQALPVIGQALPGVIAGIPGGPVGMIAGGLTSILGGQAPRPGPSAPPGAPAGGSQPAAGLLQMLLQPQVLQSLIAMALGDAGRRTLSVAGTPVPVAAIPSTLGVLANQAASEYNEAVYGEGEGESVYLGGVGDPEDPRSRAERLLWLLDQEMAREAVYPLEAWEYNDVEQELELYEPVYTP